MAGVLHMRVLSDDQFLAEACVPGARSNQWSTNGDLSAFDRTLLHALGDPQVFTQDVAAGGSPWVTIVVLSESHVSQFDALDRLLARGSLPAPIACLAASGARFDGQHGRRWEAARGNLHVSVALPVGLDSSRVGAALSVIPAIAAREAIIEASGGKLRPAIKWINDLVIAERKVGGVVTASHSSGSRIEDVIWGIGVNVEVVPPIDPSPFVPAVTSLCDQPGGEEVTVPSLFRAVLETIGARHAQLLRGEPAALLDAYRRESVIIGRSVQVWDESAGAPFAEGVVAEILDDLSLRLEGQPDRVTAGRLALLPPVTRAHGSIDRAVLAAVAAAVASRYPGARVTRVEAES